MNRRHFLLAALAALFGLGATVARAERIIVVNGWVLRESDL